MSIEMMLGIHCGATFALLKPASMFCADCGECRKLKRYEKSFGKKDFCFEVLRKDGDKNLIYVYHRKMLSDVLFEKSNRSFLEAEGYEYDDVGCALDNLKNRLLKGGEFPHEVGIFLGYPLEDVEGFKKSPSDGVLMSGYWKVYRDCERKKQIFERYKKCTWHICEKMRQGKKLAEIFGVN